MSRRLTRAELRAQTTARLLAAARRVVAERGFGAVSVDDITESAGYSRGAFYSNFANKEALLLALLRQHMDREIAELRALFADGPNRQTLVDRLERWLGSLHADSDWPLVAAEMQLHALRSPVFADRHEALQGDHRRALAEILALLFAQAGKALPVPAEQLAAIVKALAQGLALQNAVRSDPGAGVDTRAAIELVLRALIATAAPETPERRKSR